MSTQIQIALAIAALLIAIVIYIIYGGSKPTCTVDTDCTAPQTCVSGICTDPPPCSSANDCGGNPCVAGVCQVCTAAQLSKVSMPASLAATCKATTNGKYIEIPNSWVGTSDDLIPTSGITSLDQCLQSCSNVSCTFLSFNPNNNGCYLKKSPPVLGGQELNTPWSTYIAVS
jgi:hypothetical protein